MTIAELKQLNTLLPHPTDKILTTDRKPELLDKVTAQINAEADYVVVLNYLKENDLGTKIHELTAVFPKLTLNQRKLLTRHGYLPIVGTENVHRYGKDLAVPFYDYFAAAKLVDHQKQFDELLKYLRQADKSTPAYQKKAATAKRKREAAKQAHTAYMAEYRQFLEQFPGGQQRALMDLAFWTANLNHLAKTPREGGNQNEYYDMKNHALAAFQHAASPLVHTSFYRPKGADRTDVDLCEAHYEDYAEQRSVSGGYYPVMAFYFRNQKEIQRCPKCHVTTEKDYYSLYYTVVGTAEAHFSFHTPASIGEPIFGSPKRYAMVYHEENEGGSFRFGRGMEVGELPVIGGKKVILAYFRGALQMLNNLECDR
ncbi:hypothetical protein L248_0572 [Schleiferilactobacillus shenzhenensis LY-73]|uniref:Uncharacterized protein n=1 Tax=Schleiferilactobacillus shenzhenensis LY-73 TaxID=1231336 RepID=U4TMZ7_9LACO|nr:hypothetical protein L248_0572 [Schleiferilactobacillus shenzhenensis LY-73]